MCNYIRMLFVLPAMLLVFVWAECVCVRWVPVIAQARSQSLLSCLSETAVCAPPKLVHVAFPFIQLCFFNDWDTCREEKLHVKTFLYLCFQREASGEGVCVCASWADVFRARKADRDPIQPINFNCACLDFSQRRVRSVGRRQRKGRCHPLTSDMRFLVQEERRWKWV